MRVDIAGNVSKRLSMSGLKIPRYSVACPRWNVYTAFLNLEKLKFNFLKCWTEILLFALQELLVKE